MIEFFISGILFGLTAGFSPGPLSALIVSEAIQHGKKAGVKAAISPLITDLPIILICLIIVKQLASNQLLFGILALIGSGYIFYLGFQNLRIKGIEFKKEGKSESLKKGIIINALNPHPYLFWISVGIPIILKTVAKNILTLLIFLACFYFCLVGSKVLIAILAGSSRQFLTGKKYLLSIKILGALLILFSIFFFKYGLELLNIL